MTEMSRLRSASLDMTGLRLYCPPTYHSTRRTRAGPVQNGLRFVGGGFWDDGRQDNEFTLISKVKRFGSR